MSRTALAIFLVLGIIFGAAALYSLRSGAGAPADAPALLDMDPSQVRALRVEPAGGAAPVVVERQADGSWRLRREGDADGVWWPVNPGNARGAVRILAELRPLADAPATTPINEVLTIDAILDDGTARTLRVDAETLGGRRLVRTGDGRAASIDAAVVDAFQNPGPLGWRQSLALPGIGMEVSRITILGPDSTVRLARTGAAWRIDAPVRMRAGDASVRQLIGTLASARVQRFIDDPAVAADAPVGEGDTRLTIVCETDERVLGEDGQVRTVTTARTLRIGAPASVDQTAWFARTGDGQTLVVDGAVAAISTDPTAYAAATAASTRPADVGTIILRHAGGADRGFRRGIDGWSRMTPEGALEPMDAQPVEDLLAFLAQRVAPEVRFEAPEGAEPIAVVTLLDFASGPLETIGVLRTPGGVACELRPIGAEQPVYLVYPNAQALAILTN
jgi:hypothetical protein